MDNTHSFVPVTDVFWDGSSQSVNPNEILPVNVLSPQPGAFATGDGITSTNQALGPRGLTGSVVPTLSVITSTVSRTVNSSGSLFSVPGQSMGITRLNNIQAPVVSSGCIAATGFTPSQHYWPGFHTNTLPHGPQYNPHPYGFPWYHPLLLR